MLPRFKAVVKELYMICINRNQQTTTLWVLHNQCFFGYIIRAYQKHRIRLFAHARVVKLVDTLVSGTSEGNFVKVRLLSRAIYGSFSSYHYYYFTHSSTSRSGTK